MIEGKTDVLVIGGGIVGAATAYQLGLRHPAMRVTIIEKEPVPAHHQTGHNSGVVHSGIYYKPGSLKASLCRSGKQALEQFCIREQIPLERCGKVVVAADENDLPSLEALFDRGRANGVACEIVNAGRLAEIEPHVRGVKAIHIPETAITDFRAVCERMLRCVESRDGILVTGAELTGLRHFDAEIVAETTGGAWAAKFLVNCGGLQSDRIAAMTGERVPARIVPFRGEYYYLTPNARKLCRNLIYPTPDPHFPFLGVHLTRLVSGEVKAGPNAVLAFAREGYAKSKVVLRDLKETISYRGFRKLAARHWRMGLEEMWRSVSKAAFTKALQRLVPEIAESDLDGETAGVRAQAVATDGSLLDDFCFAGTKRVLNVINAPSPAATASLSIGEYIVRELEGRF